MIEYLKGTVVESNKEYVVLDIVPKPDDAANAVCCGINSFLYG